MSRDLKDLKLAEEDEAADEPVEEPVEAAEKPATTRKRGLRLPVPVAIGLAVLLAAALAAAGTFAWLLKDKTDVDTAASEALATARSFAVTLTTYDYTNLDRNFADVLDGTTGDFKNEYAGGSSTLRQLLQQAKATSQGTVLDAGVKSATTDRVEVILAANQVVTNAAIKEGQTRVDRSRFHMTLERHGDRWLVSNVRML